MTTYTAKRYRIALNADTGYQYGAPGAGGDVRSGYGRSTWVCDAEADLPTTGDGAKNGDFAIAISEQTLWTRAAGAWSQVSTGGGGGNVATDTIWDAKGDLAAGTGANTASKLTVGADDTILMADSAQATGLKWVASASPSPVSTVAATGTADTFTRGDHVHAHETAHVAHDTIWDAANDYLRGSGADTGTRQAASAATPAAVSTAGSTGTAANPPSADDHVHAHEAAHINHDTTWSAKGDLIVATANDTASVLGVGADGTVLTADSTQATGLKYAAAGGHTQLHALISASDHSGIARAVKAADETVNNSTTLQNDDDLFFSVGASEVWWIELNLMITGVSVNADFNCDFTLPASGAISWGAGAFSNGVVNSAWHTVAVSATPQPRNVAGSNLAFGLGNNTSLHRILAIYDGATGGAGSGTVQFRWAQNTLTAEDVKVLKYSHLFAYKVA